MSQMSYSLEGAIPKDGQEVYDYSLRGLNLVLGRSDVCALPEAGEEVQDCGNQWVGSQAQSERFDTDFIARGWDVQAEGSHLHLHHVVLFQPEGARQKRRHL
jgi:hypothetical protein